MSNIDKHALRQLATRATPGPWEEENGEVWIMLNGTATSILTGVCGDDTSGQQDFDNARFIAAANPATVLALLDELEAKDNRINRLEAIVAVAEQRNALMREWKRALKVPCDLVDNQVPIVIHGMVISLERQSGIIQSARKFISEYAGLGDVGAAELIKIIDRAAAGKGE